MKKKLLLKTLFAFFFVPAFSQSGQPDYSFGNQGTVTAEFGTPALFDTKGIQALPDSAGNVYVLFEASRQSIVSKRLRNGNIDPTFGNKGFVIMPGFSRCNATLQADQKLLVTGSISSVLGRDEDGNDIIASDFGVARLNPDGNFDTTFGVGGKVTTSFNIPYDQSDGRDIPEVITTTANGKIIVAGYTAYLATGCALNALARYNANGDLDNSFGTGGKVVRELPSCDAGITSLAIQPDGKIVAGAVTDQVDFLLIRFNVNGTLDSGFGTGGVQYTDFGNVDRLIAIAYEPGGKIVAVGTTRINDLTWENNFAIARYNPNGSLDSSFGSGGKIMTNLGFKDGAASSVAIQSNGRILVGGYAHNGNTYDFTIAAFKSNGELDSSFSDDGKLIKSFTGSNDVAQSLALTTDQKILIAGTGASTTGSGSLAVAKYTAAGKADKSFNGTGALQFKYQSSNTRYTSTVIQDNGKVIAVGSAGNGTNLDFAIARYNANGSADNSFGTGGNNLTDLGFDEELTSVAVEGDGKIVAVGKSQNGTVANYFLLRYTQSGKPDSTFGNLGKVPLSLQVKTVKLQHDGKIVLGFSDLSAMARYTTDGKPDSTFNGTGRLNSFVEDFAIAGDDRIFILAGNFKVVRLNKNGSVDESFVSETVHFFPLENDVSYQYSTSIRLQNDGKIVVGGVLGDYYRYSTTATATLVRFNAGGTLDKSFAGDGFRGIGFNTYSNNTEIAINADNSIIVKAMLYKLVEQSQGGQDREVTTGYGITKINEDGENDPHFGQNSQIYFPAFTEVTNINIVPGKLYVAGNFVSAGTTAFLSRYLVDTLKNSVTLSITNPQDSSQLTYPVKNLRITASVAGIGGSIAKIDFYNYSTLLFTATDTPYVFDWHNLQKGNYTITAKATDIKGKVIISNAVHFSVVQNVPPQVRLITPSDEQTYVGPANVYLAAAASDSDGRISKVEFYNGATLLGVERKLPYTFTWSKVHSGDYTITARATDNWGAVSISAPVSIHIVANQPPIISIVHPLDGASFTAPGNIPIEAHAQDPDGRISTVEFYNGATLLTTERKVPYTYQWVGVAAGPYTITAVATDNYGRKTTSAAVNISVLPPGAVAFSRGVGSNDLVGLNTTLQMQLSPNPANDFINISTAGLLQNKQATFVILSSSGKTIKTRRFNTTSTILQVDVSGLPSGVYTIKLLAGGQIMFKHFVKL